ncbi:hypothetical protein VQH23_03985 [Pararoseomonas sp. SCSIO 73927]|uniref:hypothetical protein n=1 Tax=Pararoseomonas sp. SCSIO 73927 TaxID=3114537 RepID=UPI0030CB5D9B
MNDDLIEVQGWHLESPTVWAQQGPGRRVGLGLLLRVWLDVEAETDLWTWELAETTDDSPSEIEVDVGGAATREDAMDAVLARAVTFLATGE